MLDERAIELALINLLDNALKYAKDGKRVDDRRAAPAAGRHRDPRDAISGPGIPRATTHAASSSASCAAGAATDKQVRGSGIGLALVKHIAESHGGQAWVESELGTGKHLRRPRSPSPSAALEKAVMQSDPLAP